MSAKKNEVESLAIVNAMAEESLDPETFEKWEDVMRVLRANRAWREAEDITRAVKDTEPPVYG